MTDTPAPPTLVLNYISQPGSERQVVRLGLWIFAGLAAVFLVLGIFSVYWSIASLNELLPAGWTSELFKASGARHAFRVPRQEWWYPFWMPLALRFPFESHYEFPTTPADWWQIILGRLFLGTLFGHGLLLLLSSAWSGFCAFRLAARPRAAVKFCLPMLAATFVLLSLLSAQALGMVISYDDGIGSAILSVIAGLVALVLAALCADVWKLLRWIARL